MRILVLTYAFPPLHVQMTPVALKPMAAMTKLGVSADVVTVRNFPSILPLSDDLVSYADTIFEKKIFVDDYKKTGSWTLKCGELLRLPDLMATYSCQTLHALLSLDLARYDAILTWSPFHSVNQVMMELKSEHPGVRWIAQFSDPWAGNPLERHWSTNRWNSHFEQRAVPLADAIIHSSHYSMRMMANAVSTADKSRFSVVEHCYDRSLYEIREPRSRDRFVIRYVGTLFGRRTPEPFFGAVRSLLARRPELASVFSLELVGPVEPAMLISDAASSLPNGMIDNAPHVGYLESLRYMAGADLLVLIEADVKANLFLPSKLADYVGSGSPILALVPPGAARDFTRSLGCWHAEPGNVDDISQALEQAFDHIQTKGSATWRNEAVAETLSADTIARHYKSIFERVIA
ncbi:glycosyltransferase involved in cell wall biosynthesis [Bradyrhizobium japonicum]|uniref:hypothetical protein n=1 Tax=Bradyrhizobium TaxID=374 RepID=UPI0004030CDA|nr:MULTISPECIES: hypothetical protein [Bradyrhizobium]MBR0883958.1 hypothetical protein [Bradyrhizobium liaoningense]MBR1004134.1 hypothetical protein [Bradyrhizobium liaoningense]MBR1033334.1 hypothetical protein [Bradyrhizobium liaoningense]MBR1070436.1 hypothetical protein [Bradyrhizobium liaoningense]MCP1741677.1 glycosyltransferase involved in cell wall biosynthesis [Bradyrhizobium japonicum]